METLTVWCYGTPLGARAGAVRLRLLEDRGALEVHDAMGVSWIPQAHRPRISGVRRRRRSRASETWVLEPLVRALVAASAAGGPERDEVAAHLGSSGLDDAFLRGVLAHLAPGLSALVVLSGEADLDLVRPVVEKGLASGGVTLLRADLAPGTVAEIARTIEDRRTS